MEYCVADPTDFEALVAAHRERVTRLAYRLLGWSADVEDVVQDVFLAAFKGLGRFRGDAEVGTWLTTITVNKCRSHRRRQWLTLKWFAQASREPELVRAADRGSLDLETSARVRQAVQRLPARFREVVVLRYLEEIPAGQIATVLGISANAVEVRLHRARARLKELLAGLQEE